MKPTTQNALRIAEPAGDAPVSRVRKQFNMLLKKLEAARARLLAWEEVMPVVVRMGEQELKPLDQAYAVHKRALVLRLDQLFLNKSIGKKDRAKLVDVICSLAFEVLGDGDDAEIKEIYNRHSDGDFDAEIEEDHAALQGMMEEYFGVQMDADADQQSPETIMDALRAKMARKAEQEQSAARPAAPARAKSASALAREQRQAAEAGKLKLTVREIYRKLASELHPDRESDPVERDRKTALMQRVNVAYAANDLLGLLELQLEIEQIDQAALNSLDDERIKQYNRVLEGQLRELEREASGIEHAVAMEMDEYPQGRLTPKALLRSVREDIAGMQANIDEIVADLDALQDVKKLKAFLRKYQPAVPQYEADWF